LLADSEWVWDNFDKLDNTAFLIWGYEPIGTIMSLFSINRKSLWVFTDIAI